MNPSARVAELIRVALHDRSGERHYDYYTMSWEETPASLAVAELWAMLRPATDDRTAALRDATIEQLRRMVRDPTASWERVCDILTGYDRVPGPAITALVEELRHETEPRLRRIHRISAYRLVRSEILSTPTIGRITTAGLHHPDPETRLRTVWTEWYGHESLSDRELLIEALDDPDFRVRMAAATRVPHGSDAAGLRALRRRLTVESDEVVREFVLDAITRVVAESSPDVAQPPADEPGDPAADLLDAHADAGALPALARALAVTGRSDRRLAIAAAMRDAARRAPPPDPHPERTMAAVRELIDAPPGRPPDGVAQELREQYGALPVGVGNPVSVWAVRPDGTVLRMDHDSLARDTEPETDQVAVFAVRLRAAVRHPALARLVRTSAPDGSGPCLACAGTGSGPDGPCASCSGLGWVLSPGRAPAR